MPNVQYVSEIIPSKVIVAVSMGVDSIAACEFLKFKGFEVIPIHFNHNMRESNYEMASAFKNTYDGIVGIAEKGLKTEEELRNARLGFYKKTADDTGIKKIVTGHHIDDWIEGYLLNCFRGQPDRDPIPLRTHFKIDSSKPFMCDFTVLHPFIISPKDALIQFLERTNKIHLVVEDETNEEIKGSRRNWIRNYIIPEMKKQELSLRKFAKRSIIQKIPQPVLR